MNLTTPSLEGLAYMLEAIKNKLRVANQSVINPEHFTLEHFEDILFIYNLVESKSQFSISEVEAIVAELGNMKN
jgi:uncharacterized protein YfkK (UPF0435 family)